MEGLIDLLPLLFIGAYYLLRARSRSRQQKRAVAPQQELVSDDPPRRETPFQSFMSQIEDAMAEAAGEPIDPDPAPVLPPPVPSPAVSTLTTVTVPDLAATDSEFHPTLGSFDSTAPVDHQAHGFGRDNPISEETFEQQPAFFQSLDSAPPISSPREYDPHGLRQPDGPRPGPSWRQRLAAPQAAQDAFLLQTVFGPRGGRRAERRR